MTDVKISALAAATAATGGSIPVVQSGVTKKLTMSAAGATLAEAADVAAQKTALGLTVGTDVEAYDALLAAIAALTTVADKVPYFTGTDTVAMATFTAAARTLVAAADAAAQRTALGLGTAAIVDTAFATAGKVALNPAGTGGAARIGSAVLVDGTVTIATTSALTASKIAHSRLVASGTLGHLSIANIVNGVSFDIVSDSATDESTIFWEIRA